MNQKERMLAGQPYLASQDGLPEERLAAKTLTYEFNQTHPREASKREALLRRLLGKAGEGLYIEPPFQCDYGYNIEVGKNFYANHNLIILDVAPVRIGSQVMCGPNVTLSTAGHPLHPLPRAEGYEYGIGIHIGDHVWLGANVVVNPGVSIGEGCVIGSGSVVTHDIPAGVLAYGNPCRVARAITEADRAFYYKDRRFEDCETR